MLRPVSVLTSGGLGLVVCLQLEWKSAAGQESPAQGSPKTSGILPHIDM